MLPEEFTELCKNVTFRQVRFACQDTVLGNLVWVTLLEQEGWTRQPPEILSNLNYSVIQ